MDEPRIAVEGEDDGLVLREQRVEVPVAQAMRSSLVGWSFMRFTTLMTRTFTSGICWRIRSTAARVSSVGTSPQQAITTSGSPPLSLLAHSQMPMPGGNV